MKLERLNTNKRKKIAIGTVILLCFISTLIYIGSRAKYRVTESIPLVNGTINYKPYDFKMMAMYQESASGEYAEINAMPISGYIINEEKSYCTIDNKNKDTTAKLFTNNQGQHVFENIKKNDKCYIWFDVRKLTVSDLISINNPKVGPTEITGVSITNEGMLSDTDDDGTTYYYRGAVTNNWIYFAGFYWRIIRINGDGSIRMIYNGTSTTTIGTGTQIGTKAFNNSYNSAEYVGIKYAVNSQHGNKSNSTILGASTSTDTTTLNGWYNSKIKGTQYEKYVQVNGKFCSDRSVASGHSSYIGSGVGTKATVFGPADRLFTANLSSWLNTKTPTLKCADSNDVLTMPVGLITSDEVVYAGGSGGTSNNNYYLYNGKTYWTMSPSNYGAGSARIFYVLSGKIDCTEYINSAYGVRPVINLASDITLTGSGTTSDPYKIVEN